jgi:hypothetical protein
LLRDKLFKNFPNLKTLMNINNKSLEKNEGYLADQKQMRKEFEVLDQETKDWVMSIFDF